MWICWYLLGKTREITSSELIFWRVSAIWNHCASCRYLLFKKRILQLLLLYYYNNNIIFPPCYEKKQKNIEKKRRRNKRQDKNKKKQSKVCGASSNSNTICIKNVHNRHDFYFIVSPILSQVSQVLLLQTKTKQTKKEKEGKKILLLSQFTNKLSIVCPVPLASLALY